MPALLDILGARDTRFSPNCAFLENGTAFYANSKSLDSTDESKMVSWWKISTVDQDREGDILVPAGCLGSIKTYAANPVVCWDHKRDYKLPIGTSIGTGELPVDIREHEIIAGCKHIVHNQFTSDIWTLVHKGVLRAASIGFVPLNGERMRHKGEDATSVSPRFRFSAWNLTEWSICSVGVNPSALRIELSTGSVKSPELIKSLENLAEKPKSQVTSGFEEAMKDLATIDKDAIGAIRFHKSTFADDQACQTWLFEKGFDGSAVVTNEKSYDFLQGANELSVDTAKVADGVYVVMKAFPPKKKKPNDDQEPVSDDSGSKKPPFPAKKPAKPDDKPAPDEAEAQDAPEQEEKEIPPADDVPVNDGNKPDQAPPNGDPMMDQGSITHAGQALIDIAQHMKRELRFYQESLGAHDHDGLKVLMTQAMRNCQRDYDQWMAGAKRLFPGLDFEKLSGIDDADSEVEMDNPMLDEDPNKSPDGMNETDGAAGGDLVDKTLPDDADEVDEDKKLKKSLDTLTNDDWDLLAIQTALMDVKLP